MTLAPAEAIYPTAAFDEGGAFQVNQPERPLLARVADSIYWSSRYVERAEHTSRLLWVMSQLLMDVGDLDPVWQQRQWNGLLTAMQVDEPGTDESLPLSERCIRALGLDPNVPSSIVACVTQARENARGVRSEISAEMWTILNELFWSLQGGGAATMYAESADDYFQRVSRVSLMYQGAVDQTLDRGHRWHFAQAGKLLERVDVTCRIIGARVSFLTEAGPHLEAPLRNIHLMGLLRMCCSIEAYRRQHANELGLMPVVGFLLLEADHPRSIRYGVEQAWRAVEAIRNAAGLTGVDPAERALGRLSARLAYAETPEILDGGVTGYLTAIRAAVADANRALHERYFMA